MNKCCRDAKSYLEETDVINKEELQKFIDRFNIEIENYSANGISSYLLSCVELCLKLSDSIGYTKGQVVTEWLKGHALFLGGYYSLARKCYLKALNMLDEKDLEFGAICSSYALDLAYIGKFKEALELVNRLIKSCAKDWATYTLSSILKYRNETKLSFSLLDRNSEQCNTDLYCKINRLLELNNLTEAKDLLSCVNDNVVEGNPFYRGYNLSIKLLIELRENSPFDKSHIDEVLQSLNGKKSFYHYIDGLLNIAEVYLLSGEVQKSLNLLEKIELEKRELIILDCRLYRLLEKASVEAGDFKKAHGYISRLNDISKSCTTFDIDKSLRDISDFLYNKDCSTN